jgi:hypothetical protein
MKKNYCQKGWYAEKLAIYGLFRLTIGLFSRWSREKKIAAQIEVAIIYFNIASKSRFNSAAR